MSFVFQRAAIGPRAFVSPQSFLRLPPTLRTSIYGQQSRQFSLLYGFVAIPHTLLTAIHATGLPWAAVIPVSAIAIRAFITLAISLPARHATRKHMQIMPFQAANRRVMHMQASKDLAKKGRVESKKMQALLKKTCDESDRKMEREWLSPGVRFWRWYPILQLPIFLSVMEAVRSMIGMQQGLIGAAINSLKGSPPSTTTTAEAMAAEMSVEDQAIDVPTIDQVIAPDLLATPSPSSIELTRFQPEWIEPTMTTEGLPWMLDLTIADPTPFPFAMSFLVSGLMMGNLLLLGPRKVPGLVITPFRRGLTRGLILFTLCIGPLTMHLPAGLVYYWACSSASGLAANLWMDRMYPLKRSVKACKRPLKMDY